MPKDASLSSSYSTTEIIIDCDIPPSLNRLWRVGRGRIYKDPRHTRWVWAFAHAYRAAYPNGTPPIEGPFIAEILVCPKRKRDVDNNAKILMDTLQNLGIISNDGNAIRVVQELVEKSRAPMGCRLRIVPLARS